MKTVTSIAPKSDEDAPIHPGNSTRLRKAKDEIRKLAEQDPNALVRVEAVTGLDIVPNRIASEPPTALSVRPEECWVDRQYQRNLTTRSRKLIYNIVTNWDWTMFKPPVLTRDNEGRYLVIDGQHTLIAAATHPDITKVPAMFTSLPETKNQAESFIGHNTARIPVQPLDLFHARITAEDDLAVTANKVLNDYGIQVVRSVQGQSQVWQVNQTVATGVILRILSKHGLPKFLSIVEFVSKCGFSPIRADHWRFAENLLIGPDRQNTYTPQMMIEVVKATSDNDALTEASRIAKSMGVSNYQGMLIYYKNRYNETYKVR